MKQESKITVWGYPAWTIPEIGKILKWVAVVIMIFPILSIFVGTTLHKKDLVDGGITVFVVMGIEFALVGVAAILDARISDIRKKRGRIFVRYNDKFYTANIFDTGFLGEIGYYEDISGVDVALTLGGMAGVFLLPVTLIKGLKNLMDRESKENSTRYILRECIQNHKLEKYIISGKLNDYLEPIHIIYRLDEGDKCLKILYKTFDGKKYTDKKIAVDENMSEYEELKKSVYTYASNFRMRCPSCGKEMSYGVCEFCGNKLRRKIDIKRILYKIFVSWEEK